MLPTHHHSGQLQPRRIQRRMPVLARAECAPQRVWWRLPSLSSTGPQLHCDWLWVLQPPPSGCDAWWCCVPNQGRILKCERFCRTNIYLILHWRTGFYFIHFLSNLEYQMRSSLISGVSADRNGIHIHFFLPVSVQLSQPTSRSR